MGGGYNPELWHHRSPDAAGMHTVIGPANSQCRTLRMHRLNLDAGSEFKLESGGSEWACAVTGGVAVVLFEGEEVPLSRLDSFYLPGGVRAVIKAAAGPLSAFLGEAPYDGAGEFFTRRFEPGLPEGPVRQVHGRPPYEREVFMTLDPETPASRLIAGFTRGARGAWTSWPPHQHEQHLEEAYCYFDMPPPHFGLHLSYIGPGRPAAVHVVRSGSFVEAPAGYHPTVAAPGSRNSYFWVLAAHAHSGRRYDLAVEDPNYAEGGVKGHGYTVCKFKQVWRSICHAANF